MRTAERIQKATHRNNYSNWYFDDSWRIFHDDCIILHDRTSFLKKTSRKVIKHYCQAIHFFQQIVTYGFAFLYT